MEGKSSKMPAGGEIPAKINPASTGKGAGVVPCKPVGKPPGSAIPGFTGGSTLPGKV